MAVLEPDRYFSRISVIDIQRDIIDCGYTHVLLDIDNTILRRDTHEVPRDILFWLSRARAAGIEFCLLSNNWHKSVYELAEQLQLPLVAKAVKPLPPAFLMAKHKIGAKRPHTLVIGDQLITDILGARVLGIAAYLLIPLVEQDLKHTLLLRRVERLFIKDREPEGAFEFSESSPSAGVAGFTDSPSLSSLPSATAVEVGSRESVVPDRAPGCGISGCPGCGISGCGDASVKG